MPLTDTAIKNAKPKDRPYKLSDERGLFVLVNSSGSKLFRFKYRFDGKEKLLALGAIFFVSERGEKSPRSTKALLERGEDPSAFKKAEKQEKLLKAATSFETVAREYVDNQARRHRARYREDALRRLEQNIFPYLGSRPIAEIEAPELLAALRKVESRGAHEMAARVRMLCGQVFRYGIATGRCKRDPAADLRGALIPHKVRHQPAVKPQELLVCSEISRLTTSEPTTRAWDCNLWLTLLFRTIELVPAEWTEFDFKDAIWNVPALRMKMQSDHYVPLAGQSLKLLEELKAINGESRYVLRLSTLASI